MKGPLLTEGARNLVVAYLKANLNTAMKNSDIVRADGISLGQVDDRCFYISEIYQALQMPSCYVLTGNFKFDYSEDPNYIKGILEMRVIMPAEAMEGSELQKKVETYGRVLFNLLDQQDLVDSNNRIKAKIISDSIEYGDVLESKTVTKFRRDCIYRFKVMSVENRQIA